MQLIFKKEARRRDLIVQGTVEIHKEDKALSKTLERIGSEGIAGLDLRAFESGLRSNFVFDGLLDQNGKLTNLGKDIAKNGYRWKGLQGRFIVDMISCDDQRFILNLDTYTNKKKVSGFEESQKTISLDKEYLFKNGKDGYRSLKADPFILEGSTRAAELSIEYDFEDEISTYSFDNRVFSSIDSFRHMDTNRAQDILKSTLENYNLTVNNYGVVLLESENISGTLLRRSLQSIFEKGSFSAISADKVYEIENIRLSIKNKKVAEEVLHMYLSEESEKRYCGQEEIESLISGFYKFFKECPELEMPATDIIEALKNRTKIDNPMANLRLMACSDLSPEAIRKKYKEEVIPLTNESISIRQFAERLVGDSKICSVIVFNKFAYSNENISKAMYILASAIRHKYGIPMTLVAITKGKNKQSSEAKDSFERLKTSDDVVFKEVSKAMFTVHDRYYLIRHKDGKDVWKVMTGELDKIIFDSLTEVDENTVGKVKEMTIVQIKEEGIPPEVIKMMEAI